MSNKTSLRGYYNEDDFVERDGAMHELTVTITLCEYRNLIRETTRLELELELERGKYEELEEKCRLLSKALAACKVPQFLKDLGRMLAGDDPAEEPDDQEDEAEEPEEDDG